MTLRAVICRTSPVKLWGLTGETRLARQLAKLGVSVGEPHGVPEAGGVVVLRGDYLFDGRLLDGLAKNPWTALRSGPDGPVVGVHVPPANVAAAVAWLENRGEPLPEATVSDPDQMVGPLAIQLRKTQRPFAVPVTPERRPQLERFLYDTSYKGVTDLVTKWVWPVPARYVVKACVRLGIQANHVTVAGFLLMLVALWAFWQGHLAWGLVPAWIMTFFDTVDGKLARTTLTASRFGHLLDKLTDIFHPPFWYFAWAVGVPASLAIPHDELVRLSWWILLAYLFGRFAEAACHLFVRGGLFMWKPLDSYFRLITARRNTCLIILHASLLLGRPDDGFRWVAYWSVGTTLFMIGRLGWAWMAWRGVKELIRPWLVDVDPAAANAGLATRLFTQPPPNL